MRVERQFPDAGGGAGQPSKDVVMPVDGDGATPPFDAAATPGEPRRTAKPRTPAQRARTTKRASARTAASSAPVSEADGAIAAAPDGDGAMPATTAVREVGTAVPGELTGPLPVVAPAGRRNGRARAVEVPVGDTTQTNALRRTRVIVRRLGPLSVFRFTLLYSFSVMLVVYLALAILYTVLGALGVMDSVAKTIVSFGGGGAKGFSFNGGWIFSRLFVVGVAIVLVWSVLKAVASVIYNLVSNIVGGIEVTLAERR